MKHTFLKHALWTALFVAGAALAQDAAISGAEFTHGNADAQLATIGSHAAADGKTVVVTAPAYWQKKVAAKIRAGAHGKPVAIRFSNGFYENVLVRTEAAAPAQALAKPVAKPKAKPEARPEPEVAAKAAPKIEPKAHAIPAAKVAEVEPRPEAMAEAKPSTAPASKPAVAAVPASKPAEPPHVAAPTPMQAPVQQPPASASPQVASNIVAVPQVSHQPVVVPIPTAAINTADVKPVVPAASLDSDASVRQRMLASLNDGRPAMGSLTEAQLRSGDQVYADGGTRAVVRLEGLHRDLYWLQGPVDLQRVQFMPQGSGHYEVIGLIDPKAPVVHRQGANAHQVVASVIPAPGSAARARLQQQYNNGQPITGSLAVARLQPEDRLLVDGTVVIVARREGNSMTRYWLSGSIDLGQSGIQKLDGNAYRVVGNSLH